MSDTELNDKLRILAVEFAASVDVLVRLGKFDQYTAASMQDRVARVYRLLPHVLYVDHSQALLDNEEFDNRKSDAVWHLQHGDEAAEAALRG